MMKKIAAVFLFLLAIPVMRLSAQAGADQWKPLTFLEGTWEAKTGPGDVQSSGTYTFKPELNGHILARHSTSNAGCKGPATFDCEHGDLLYLYKDAPGQPMKAIYFDNEGHVIHYEVTTPDATTAVFLSDASQPGPQFRLTYELKGAVMTGKFQMHMPGSADWKSYLEWSGGKK
jgi:hypothetical protein